MIKNVNENNVNTLNDGLVVAKFGAKWCGPCRQMAPVLEALDTKNPGTFTICDIDVDEMGTLAQEYGVRGVPTTVFLKDGVEQDRVVGFISEDALLDKINNIA
jgi:thioredoxin 1